jgi:hypothetical protein
MLQRKLAFTVLACVGLAAALGAAPIAQVGKGALLSLEKTLENPRFLDLSKLPDLTQAAGKGLDQFRSLVDAESFQDMGLADAASAAKAGLGTPKRDFLIRLDALQGFKAGGDIEALLVDTKIIHYPIVIDGKAVSSISMVSLEGKWETVSIGDVQRTSLRRKAIDNSVKRFAKAEEDHFIVRIPALNMEFTAFRDRSDALQLASVSDNPMAGLIAGEAEPAAKVIPRLLPLALADDGMPH